VQLANKSFVEQYRQGCGEATSWCVGRGLSVHLEHFTYGALTPTLSYTLSVLGSLLGLLCTVRARAMTDRGRRARWLVLAAWAIGGTGIWVMHFMAMIGFSIPGYPIKYDIPTTIASWIIAMVVVAIGLFIVGFGKPSVIKILAAGVFTGVGVAAMHYSGMAAMRTSAVIRYDTNTVAASVAHVAPDRDHSVTAAGDGVVLDRVTWSPTSSEVPGQH